MSPGPCPRCGFEATLSAPQAPHERQEIKAFIGRLRHGLQETNSAIQRLRAALAAAEADRDTLAAKMDAYTALNPPIHDVPTEILVRIFSFAVERPFAVFDQTQPSMDAPWVLGRICSRWRTVAWGTPSLWSNFEMRWYDARSYWDKKPKCVERVKAVLARSEQTALSTRFEMIPRCLAPFVGHASRLHHLSILCQPQSLRHLKVFGELSGLQKLTIRYLDTGRESAPLEKGFDFFDTALQLVDVEFDIGNSLPVRLPWVHLTRLKVQAKVSGAGTIALWKRIYERCSNLAILEHCLSIKPKFHEDARNDEVYNTSVTLPPVQHLHVSSPYQLKLFSCPSLETLGIDMDMIRADCIIHKLKLRNVRDSPAIRNFLSSFGTVTELEIEESRCVSSLNRLLPELEYDKDRLCFPRLQALTIRTHEEWDLRGELALIRVIESRWNVPDVEPLHTVRLKYHWEHYASEAMVKTLGLPVDISQSWNPKLHKRLKEFEEEGLKVEIARMTLKTDCRENPGGLRTCATSSILPTVVGHLHLGLGCTKCES
ncbi:hypothetical protein BDZ89DRAFT_1061648 [Hymenopellis radicata]|nr:hypothetical protein BDZ89DRAFT_1061648 [Hymenopellis radicata]